METNKQRALYSTKLKTINTFPAVGGGISICEGRKDFHPQVRDFCTTTPKEGLAIGEKLIVVGTHNIGKSCLIRRYVEDQFTDGYKATIGVDFMYQKYKILDLDFTMHIWDTAGQEQFKCVSRAYFRGAGAVILAFDLGNEKTLEDVHEWLGEVKRENATPFLTFLVGLKADTYHAVDSEMGQRVAAQMNAEYWECSSKNNTNVQELFSRIAVGLFECAVQRQIKEADSYHSKPQVAHTLEFSERGASINSNTTDSKTPPTKNKSCCFT